MYSLTEHLIASLLNYLPFVLLYLYAFRGRLRFSKAWTIVLTVISTIIRLWLIRYEYHIPDKEAYISDILNYIELSILVLFSFLAVKSRWGRMMFVLLMMKNTADVTVILAKFFEHLFFPQEAELVYHWTYSLCEASIELITLPIVWYILKTFFTVEIREEIAAERWRILWIVPLFFYFTWVYVFYYSSDLTEMELAFSPPKFSVSTLLHRSSVHYLYCTGYVGSESTGRNQPVRTKSRYSIAGVAISEY